MSLGTMIATGRHDLASSRRSSLATAHGQQPLTAAPLLSEADLAHLPPSVQRFVRGSGALGRPRVQRFRAELDAELFRRPGGAPVRSTSIQHNFTATPARIFFMRSRLFGLPLQVLQVYAEAAATFRVRVASVDVVEEQGERLSRAETVTVLNDLCLFAPGALVDRRLSWAPGDGPTARVTFANGPHRVAATLVFNDRDELVDFTSDDRPALQDGKLVQATWSTPMAGYQQVDGRRLPTRGAAVYRYPTGDFTYGRFRLRSIAFDDAARPGG
jgi:hypothetical protein